MESSDIISRCRLGDYIEPSMLRAYLRIGVSRTHSQFSTCYTKNLSRTLYAYVVNRLITLDALYNYELTNISFIDFLD